MQLNLQANFHHAAQPSLRDYSAGDDFYQMLIDAHRDLNEADSAALNAKLILLLANHIGDIEVLKQALSLAGSSTQAI
ncbi:DUF2783 domain-containing protein [Undibacterium sp. TJN19]|uniref:DUF2783 domain-containing protein n=1 Tax=Undibacterium sp. TJN19 TaxID=3413055 RepID=UPI003BF083AF